MPSNYLFREGMLRECWNFRGFIVASVKRDFVSRYLGTQLGFFWAVAQPLAMIAIYTVVFAEIMKPAFPGHTSKFAYSVYLCAGIIIWQLFSDVLSRAVSVFVQNANLLKKVDLPKISLPVIVALSGLLNFAVVLALFVGFLVIIGQFPGAAILAMLAVVALTVALAVALGVLLGTINVFYRDVEQTMSMLLQFWFWLTPIVYPGRSLPGIFAGVLAWNPMWPIVSFAQTIFVEHRVPSWMDLRYPAILAVVLMLGGLFTFRRLSGELVDEL